MSTQPASLADPAAATAPARRPTPRQLARALITPDRRRARPARQMPMPDSLAEIDGAGVGMLIRQWAPAHGATPTGLSMVLIHGWEGSHADMAGFVVPLRAKGFTVFAPDLPAHGGSGGSTATIPQLAVAVAATVAHAARHAGAVQGVIAHSIGCAATAVALLDGADVARVALVSSPVRYLDGARAAAARFGYDAMEWTVFEAELLALGTELHAMNLARQARELRQPALFFHSTDDRVVPIEAGRASAAAWPGARMIEHDGLGHGRILTDPAVIAAAVDFVARSE